MSIARTLVGLPLALALACNEPALGCPRAPLANATLPKCVVHAGVIEVEATERMKAEVVQDQKIDRRQA